MSQGFKRSKNSKFQHYTKLHSLYKKTTIYNRLLEFFSASTTWETFLACLSDVKSIIFGLSNNFGCWVNNFIIALSIFRIYMTILLQKQKNTKKSDLYKWTK